MTEIADCSGADQDDPLRKKWRQIDYFDEHREGGGVDPDRDDIDADELQEVAHYTARHLEHKPSVENEGDRNCDGVGNGEADQVAERY